jgi:hypothetical protein
LDEADAVLLGRGFHGAGVEHFVVEVDILEVFEVLILVFDPEVAGVFGLSRCHGGVWRAASCCGSFETELKEERRARVKGTQKVAVI